MDVQSLLQDWMDDFFESLPEAFDAVAEAEYAEDDDCGPEDGDSENDDPEARVAASAVTAMRDYIYSVPQRERLEAMQDVLSVVGVWEDLYLDHEKTVGHLLLEHGESGVSLVDSSHKELLHRHATLHEQEGARHSSST